MLLLGIVVMFETKTIQNTLCSKALQSYRQALEQICSSNKLSFVSVSDDRVLLKKL